jgi:hypothetical protein
MTGNRREFKVQALPVRDQDDINSELLSLQHRLKS